LPDEYINKLYQKCLSENLYKNRGFVLDGYPRTHSDCLNIFQIKKEGEEDTINKELFPDFFFLLTEGNRLY